MQRKKIITLVAVALGILGIIFLLGFKPHDVVEEAPTVTSAASGDHMRGEPNAPILLIEYSDFQCPACAAYHPLVTKLLGEYGNSILFVYRHFPLPQHVYAEHAAQAAEAAGLQGKFWEMHDMLFSRQSEWAQAKDIDGVLASYAEKLGLHLEQFKEHYAFSEVKAKIRNDFTSGRTFNVTATPTFFLNGKKMEPAGTYEEFATRIEAALPN